MYHATAAAASVIVILAGYLAVSRLYHAARRQRRLAEADAFRRED